jgi:hypothetical protein
MGQAKSAPSTLIQPAQPKTKFSLRDVMTKKEGMVFRECLFLSLLFAGILHFSSGHLYSQEEGGATYYINHLEDQQTQELQDLDADYSEPMTAFYLELLGKGFYSFNLDFRRNKSKAWSLGIQHVEGVFIASLMYYRFRGKRYRFELGGGLSGIFSGPDGGIMIHGVLGYRYQKKKGLIFRIGFTPLIGIPLTSEGRFVIVPWVGMSLGYSL